MIESLSIKNFALIDDIKVTFDSGLTMITGETGAGKSVMLGALSLLLGSRADLEAVKEKSSKCIIEGQFGIANYNLTAFFTNHDLDYEVHTIIRRELLPTGKSRAFINDTPVTLQILSELGAQLIDIHSQHETLNIGSGDFKFYLIDTLAGNFEILKKYREALVAFKKATQELAALEQAQASAAKEFDYNSFLLNELEALQLDNLNEESIEEEQEMLANVASIQDGLGEAYQLLSNEDLGLVNQISSLTQKLKQLSGLSQKFADLAARAESMRIELSDLEQEVYDVQGDIEPDPKRLETLESLIQQIYDLKRKHAAQSVEELIKTREDLSKQIALVQDDQNLLQEARNKTQELTKKLTAYSDALRKSRTQAVPKVISGIGSRLQHLELIDARIEIKIQEDATFNSYGKDTVEILFSANKGMPPAPLKKVASGGEMSRLMLAIKALLARETSLSTLIFDEIDTGVSGLVANKMGDIMQQMSKHMQVICITHLPQVAAKGKHQFKVYKETEAGKAATKIVKLNAEERIVEIAQMLGGLQISETAINHAKELLN